MTKHQIPVEPFRPADQPKTDQMALLDHIYDFAIFTSFSAHKYLIDPLIFRPIRALVLAYSYVIRGKKVETPIRWTDI